MVSKDMGDTQRSLTQTDLWPLSHQLDSNYANFIDFEGDPEYGVWTAGLCIGLIKDIPTCEVLVARIEQEALDTISKQLSYVKDRARL